jgi:hypothetical protein
MTRNLRPLLEGRTVPWEDAIFMEQEIILAIRTHRWLVMKRLGPSPYDFPDALYDVEADSEKRNNLAGDPARAEVIACLAAFTCGTVAG